MEKLDAIRKAVRNGELPRELNHFSRIDRVNSLRACPASQESEDSGTATEIDNHITGPHSALNGVGVRTKSSFVGDHVAEFFE